FNKDGCTILNNKNEIVVHCEQNNGVYKFENVDSVASVLLAKDETDAMLWHRRLGHLNFESMKKMRDGIVKGVTFHDNSTINIKNCETCAMGKQTRRKFAKSERTSKNILDLVHSDLMGPMENLSIGKAKYILTFVDDYSRKVFVYFLKSKDEVFEKIVYF
ncbi:MAG TPA: hypothetical protein DDZ41_05350, partial [Flavobacterium sp.]|nr:hypothetical protein [Flavobacterium sp.]